MKNVPGRKTDMADAEWLADVAAHGMVRPSLVPGRPARAARAHPLPQVSGPSGAGGPAPGQGPPRRRHQDLLGASTRLGQVGRAMVEPSYAGERDPTVLADLPEKDAPKSRP